VTHIHPERLEYLILARLALRSAAPTPKDVSKTLYTIVARQLTKSEWDAMFERALDGLRAAGLVGAAKPTGQGSGAPSKKRAARKKAKAGPAKTSKRGGTGARAAKPAARQGLTMTPAGQKRLQSALGAKSRVAARDWAELERKYMPALLVPGAAAASKKQPELAAVLLGQRLGVSVDRALTQEQVLDAWLCSSLGLRAGQRLTLDNLRAALLARELGLPQRRSLKLQDVLGLAAVQLSGAASGADGDVSAALLLRWLSEARPEPKREPPPTERIAAKALRAAEGPEAREFGPNKVFIGSVWRALAGDPELSELGEAAFKRQLVEAHRRGLLVLSRADLVAAMDPSDVAASEIIHQNATYHFICRGASA
jgi:hypothetical protein